MSDRKVKIDEYLNERLDLEQYTLWDVDTLLEFLDSVKKEGATHVEFDVSVECNYGHEVSIELRSKNYIYETDEEMEARISKEKEAALWMQERNRIKKEKEQEERDRQEYQRLKAKYENGNN